MKPQMGSAFAVLALWLASDSAVAGPDPEPVAVAAAAATTSLVLRAMEYKGCYNSSDGLTDYGPYTWQSSGWCQKVCVGKNFKVLGLWKGSDCFCGDVVPPASALVDDSQCNSGCYGINTQMCGGKNAYGIFLTGLDSDPPTYSSSVASSTTTSTSQSSTSAETTHAVTKPGGETIIVTEPVTSVPDKKGGGSNTAAIAAGVVVGVVGLCAIVGALFFVYRYKKRKAVEEEYRRNAMMNNYPKSAPDFATNDSRFDREFLAQRRQSNGSIDDDQDFSRRILQVTNPDR